MKLNSVVIFALLAVGAFFASMMVSSCTIHIEKRGNGNQIKKSFAVDDFSGISLSGHGDVVLTVSDSMSVSVEASESFMERIEIFTDKDGVLRVNLKDKDLKGMGLGHFGNNDYTVYISAPTFSKIDVMGSCTVECKDSIVTDDARISIVGAGDLKMNRLVADNVNIELAGSGDFRSESVVASREFNLNVAGAADANLSSLTATNVTTSISGSGNAVMALKTVRTAFLDVCGSGDMDVDFDDCGSATIRVSGSGDINLTGNLEHLEQSSHGSGDINTHHLKVKR